MADQKMKIKKLAEMIHALAVVGKNTKRVAGDNMIKLFCYTAI